MIRYKNMMNAKNFDELSNYIDIDKFAKFEAMRIIFASKHAIAGDNLKLLYDTTKGKFSPYFRMEGYLNKLPKTELSNTFDKGINSWFGYDYDIKLFPILNQNNQFRFVRNKYLFEILKKSNLF